MRCANKEVAASKSPKAASYPPAFRARMQIQNITKIEKSWKKVVLFWSPANQWLLQWCWKVCPSSTVERTNMLRSQLDNPPYLVTRLPALTPTSTFPKYNDVISEWNIHVGSLVFLPVQCKLLKTAVIFNLLIGLLACVLGTGVWKLSFLFLWHRKGSKTWVLEFFWLTFLPRFPKTNYMILHIISIHKNIS